MRGAEDELEARGIQVVVVTFDREALARSYVEQTGLRWPILVDGERTLYHAYGMDRGSAWEIFGPAAIWSYLKLLLKGRWPKPAGEDVAQLGGDVLVDPADIVRLHHIGRGPADRPPVAHLLRVAQPLREHAAKAREETQ